jgi:hypothetical protein
MSPTPTMLSAVAPEPVNGNGPVDGFVVVVALPSVVTAPANVVVVPVGFVDVVSPAVVTVTGTVVDVVVVDEPGSVVVDDPVVVDVSRVVDDSSVVDVGGTDVVDASVVVVVGGAVVVVVGSVVGGAVVVVTGGRLQLLLKTAIPSAVQFFPGYVSPAPKSKGGMMSPHFSCFGIAGKNTGPSWPSCPSNVTLATSTVITTYGFV